MANNRPEDLTYGKVIGIFKTIEIDSNQDADQLPDHYPMQGVIRFTPSIPYSKLLLTGPGSTVFFKTSISAMIDNEGNITSGQLDQTTGKPELGVTLLATDDPNLSVSGWTYNVTFSLRSYTGAPVSVVNSKDISVFGGQELDLAKALEEPNSPGLSLPAMESAVLRAEGSALVASQLASESAQSSQLAEDSASASEAFAQSMVTANDTTMTAVASDPNSEFSNQLNAAIGEWDGNFSQPFTSMGDLNTGAGFIAKSATVNPKQGVIGWQHASNYGYLLHFESRPGGAAPGAMIGIGLDYKAPDGGLGVSGILIANKVGSQGIVISNGPNNDNANGFGIYGAQDSTVAALVALHQRVNNAANLLELKVSGGTPSDSQRLVRFVIARNDLAGDVSSKTGEFRWLKKANLRETQVNTTLTLRNDTGTGVPALLVFSDSQANSGLIEVGLDPTTKANSALSLYRPTGAGTNWGFRLTAISNVAHLQGSPASAKGSEVWKSNITFTDLALGFYGATAVTQQSIAAAATDAASTQTLVNDLRAKLLALGLVKNIL